MLAFLQRKRCKPWRAPRRGVSLQVEVLGGRVTPSTFALDGTLAPEAFVPLKVPATVEQPVAAETHRYGEEVPALAFVPIHAQDALDQLLVAGTRRPGEEVPA